MIIELEWHQYIGIPRRSFTCGHCGNLVAQDRGYIGNSRSGHKGLIYPCPNCSNPTYIDGEGKQHPAVRIGREVTGIDDSEVESLYKEARDCSSVGAYTGTILICRKILMNLAVHQGADAGKSFIFYIDYLNDNGFVPPNGKAWVDEIRKKGNIATHEAPSPSEGDASQIITFIEMLLRFVYEFPSMVTNENP